MLPKLSLMKIALIMHELLMEGGGERQCLSLAQALARQGHKVTVYTSAYDASGCFPDTCRRLAVKDIGRGWFSWLSRPRFIRGFLDMVRLAASVNEEHDIWNPHHWPAQWGAVWLKRRLGGTVLWMCNDVPDFWAKSRGAAPRNIVVRAVHRMYYRCDRKQNASVDLTMLLSQWAESEFKAVYAGPTCVVRSGVDPSRFFPGGDRKKIRSRFGYSDSEFVLLWLGIFMPHRRLEDAIEGVHRLRCRGVNVRLLMAGSTRCYPDYATSLRKLVDSLDLADHITFAPKVGDEEIRDFYSACDVFVFPNEQQTWGLAVLEAMACGCPVLVSRGAAVHEVLQDGVTASLFPPRSPDILADKIETIVCDSRLRNSLAMNGMRLVHEKYNWERFADQIASICRKLRDRKDINEEINVTTLADVYHVN